MSNEETHTLGGTRIWRKPHTGSQFGDITDSADLRTGFGAGWQLWLGFTASASGGSTFRTDYRIEIGTDDYAAIIKAMCNVDEDAALSAMADELAERLRTRP